jgi:hypothetical protein
MNADKIHRSNQFKFSPFSSPLNQSDIDNGRYIGDWDRSQKNGYGILLFVNGDQYLGQFKNNEFSGKGIYYFENGNILQGEFLKNNIHGLGRFESRDESESYEYYGCWVNGKKEGFGRLLKYSINKFRFDKKIIITYNGYWLNDVFHGEGLFEDEDIQYCGAFENGLKSGFGKLLDKEQNYRYEGFFANNLFEGKGDLIFSDKTYYSGEFKNNRQNGRGYYKDLNGIEHIGEWRNGYCPELLEKFLQEYIKSSYDSEFNELEKTRLDWDRLFVTWNSNIKSHINDLNNIDDLLDEIKIKLNKLDIYLANFDELIEEDIFWEIYDHNTKIIQYYCCDYPNLWGDPPDAYQTLLASDLYRSRKVLYEYYMAITDELNNLKNK